MTKPRFRVIDTGLRSGRENIAFDQGLIEVHCAGEVPDTIRFIHFKPVALVGRHQSVAQEVHADFCRDNGVDIGRRITGGGAIYLDPDQMGWSLTCKRASLGGGSLGDLTKAICEASAAGLSKLGMKARYRPRNDIEVGGRKISGTGGFFDGDTVIYQGTVLGDVNPDIMFNVLNVPRQKLEKHALDKASLRVTTLQEVLGRKPAWREVQEALLEGFAEELGIIPQWGDVTKAEEACAQTAFVEEIGTDEFVYEVNDPRRAADVRFATHTGAGGSVTAHLRVEGARNERIREVLITGDFFVTPPRMVLDLEASLRRIALEDIEQHIENFMSTSDIGLLSVAPKDFAAAITAAAEGFSK